MINTIILEKGEDLDLSRIFGDDEDFNGNNGKDFTSQEALDNGFSSDLEYHTFMAEELYQNDTEKIAEHVLDKFMHMNKSYYEMEIDVTENGTQTIVSYYKNILL